MKYLIGVNEFINESFGVNFINKAIRFCEKIKDLVDSIIISDEELEKIAESPSVKSAVLMNKNFYSQVKDIYVNNKPRIQRAYDEVFGMNEEFIEMLLISFAIMIAFYWAQRRGYIDKLLGKIDPKCKDGSCGGPVSGDEWKYKSKKKSSWFGGGKTKQIEQPKRLDTDQILDKINKVGYKNLTPEEKAFINRK